MLGFFVISIVRRLLASSRQPRESAVYHDALRILVRADISNSLPLVASQGGEKVPLQGKPTRGKPQR